MSNRSSLVWYIVGRVGSAALVVAAASVLIFAAMELLPGDAADVMLSRQQGSSGGAASAEQKELLRADLGLDRPLAERYVRWIGGIGHGDLGRSLFSHRPVTEIIGARLANTVILAAVAAACLIPLAIGFGVWAGARAGRAADRLISAASLTVGSLPEFVIATFLIQLFALALPLFPPISLLPYGENPLHSPEVLVLPIATLVAVMAPQTIRMVRAQMSEVMRSSYIQMARLHGIPDRRIITHHALRNAVAPAAPLLASSIAWLVGGIIVVETVFNYPGLSRDLVHAIGTRDLPYV
ncbi:MAG: ABC transporter permease, partial [Haloechinothrix sp.]